MEQRPAYIYSSEDTPKLLRPPKPNEDHIWHRPDGKSFKLNGGVWEEWRPESELDA